MIIYSPISFAFAAAVLAASTISAQRPDSARCRSLLTAPVKDSVVVTVGLTTRAFDSTKALSASYRAELAVAIRQVLRLPRPLPVQLYSQLAVGKKQSGRDSMTVVPTIAGAYAAELLPNGRLTKLRVIGGARVAAFDDAFLGALQMLSDSGLVPPRSDETQEALELRFTVGAIDVASLGTAATKPSFAEPLFRMRVPALGEGTGVAASPANESPRFPENARRANVEGTVRLRFVVKEDGRGDRASIQVEQATALDFVSAVLATFPSLRFVPLELRGCPLASVVEVPFNFQLSR